MSLLVKTEYEDRYGAKHIVLVSVEELPKHGIPLLDLSSLQLDIEMETILRKKLWDYGIRELSDVKKAGVNEKIHHAILSTFRASVHTLKASWAEDEQAILELMT